MLVVVWLLVASWLMPFAHVADDPSAVANENRRPAGTGAGDTLVLRLTLGPAIWRIYGDDEPGFRVAAFAEEGKPFTIPGPLVRVRVGTPIHVFVRNPLADTLILRGLTERGGMNDSLIVLPGSSADVAFVARRVGTFQYWGALAAAQRLVSATVRDRGLIRGGFDSQLAGAFVVDPEGPVPADRVMVITEISDQPPGPARRDRRGAPGREFTAVNGKSWPHSERLQYRVGDTIRWRIVNTTFQAHPMHLHGFYFRVDSHGDAPSGTDSIYSVAQRRMAVTELVRIGQTTSITWMPDRPGAWVFHCHLTNHAAKLPPVNEQGAIDYPDKHGHGDADRHFTDGMNGLVIGINVLGGRTASRSWRPAKRLRLFVQSDSAPRDSVRRFGYVLQRGAEPRRDSIERPGPLLMLTRGEPTSIQVVNRSTEPTSVHWHGIELESYYDGAVGWSGDRTRTARAIRPDSSFEVRITPRRAGTFMYHTHFDEMRQQYGGLVGPLIVVEPGERWDPARDLLFLISETDRGALLVNGSAAALQKDLRVGTKYRIRVADIAAYRQSLFARVVRDTSLVSWRPIARDGFTLPGNQAVTRPSFATVASGETADFELTPSAPGELRLEFGTRNRAGVAAVQGTVLLRVSAQPLR